jgi:hypothetical protein
MQRLLFGLLFALLALPSCGGGEPKDSLVDALPGMMPNAQEINEKTATDWELQPVPESTGVMSNADLATAEEITVREVDDSGRLGGYQIFYKGGPHPQYPLIMAGATRPCPGQKGPSQAIRLPSNRLVPVASGCV